MTAGARIDYQTRDGKTALNQATLTAGATEGVSHCRSVEQAAWNGQEASIELLVESGAQVGETTAAVGFRC